MDLSDVCDALTTLTGRKRPRKVLEIDLARGVVTAPPENPLAALKLINAASMAALREGLRAAATDEAVAGLIVRVAPARGLGITDLQELGEMVAEFDAHKPTVAWAESFGELDSGLALYTLATRARQVWVQPSGLVGLAGVHAGITLLRGLLEKGGVEPEFAQRKEYKSAAERFAGREISEPHREQVQRLADSVLDSCVATIAERRGLSVERVRELIDERVAHSADEALAAGLVDRVGYRDEVYSATLADWKIETDALQFVHRYEAGVASRRRAKQMLDRHAPRIGVVSLRGGIVTGRGRGPGGGEAGADVVTEHLRAAARDERVKAVVLRINSPGGSAVASDSIWRAVKQVRASGRPVVAQMGEVAASGGYYSAMGADAIVALPSTITGSIGVLAGKFVLAQTYEKLGLVHEGVGAGRNAGWLSSDSRFTEDQWHQLNGWLDQVYDDFVTKAAEGRGLTVEQLEPLARGRVWTGADALDHKLVDELGGLETAIARACTLAGVSRDRAVPTPVPAMGMLERLRPANSSEQTNGGGVSGVPAGPEALVHRALETLGLGQQARLLTGPVGALTLPWDITIR